MGNESSRDYEAGDILYRDTTQFKLANHYAVYIGGNNVIDLTKENGIQKRSVSEFAQGCRVNVKRYESAPSTGEEDKEERKKKKSHFFFDLSDVWSLPRYKIVEKAIYLLNNGEEWGNYNLVFNNCEHFASYCATGEKISGQVGKVKLAVTAGASVAFQFSYGAVIGTIFYFLII